MTKKKQKGIFLTTWTIFEGLQAGLLVPLLLIANISNLLNPVVLLVLSMGIATLVGVYFVWNWDIRGYYIALGLLAFDVVTFFGVVIGQIDQTYWQVFIGSLLEILWVYSIYKKKNLFK